MLVRKHESEALLYLGLRWTDVGSSNELLSNAWQPNLAHPITELSPNWNSNIYDKKIEFTVVKPQQYLVHDIILQTVTTTRIINLSSANIRTGLEL